MPLINATREAILKVETKDEFYRNFARQHVSRSFQTIFGDQKLITWQNELKVFADLLYFGLTTLSGLQTLGEEYGGMIQVVGGNKKTIPSLVRRFVYICMKSISPYILKKILDGHIVHYFEGMDEKEKHKFKIILDFIKNFMPTFHLFHTLIFYLDGVYCTIAKRLCKIKYVLVRPIAVNETDVRAFKIFAALTAIQIICNSYREIQTLLKDLKLQDKKQEAHHNLFPLTQSRNKASHATKCILCLENITHMSATPCGHVFCWQCIMEAINTKNECPACRKATKLSRIIYLQHFHMK